MSSNDNTEQFVPATEDDDVEGHIRFRTVEDAASAIRVPGSDVHDVDDVDDVAGHVRFRNEGPVDDAPQLRRP